MDAAHRVRIRRLCQFAFLSKRGSIGWRGVLWAGLTDAGLGDGQQVPQHRVRCKLFRLLGLHAGK